MAIDITWLGHNCWLLDTGEHKLLIDPFLDDSPVAPIKSDAVETDFILVSHGHFDHIADAVKIAKRTGATVLANFEVSNWLGKQGVSQEKQVGMNPGGATQQPFGKAKLTVAHHSSSMPDGTYGGVAGGWLLETAGKRIYFACDTALFGDMKMIAQGGLDLAVLPIGDLFTMGVEDSVEGVKLLTPKQVAPCHYNTWPSIAQNAQGWAQRVRDHTAAKPIVLEPGDRFQI
jgi:L-ascorbate metabolism protein UlaG (beta-lactamase superfamily)